MSGNADDLKGMAERRLLEDFGTCEHGVPHVFGHCEVCEARFRAERHQRFTRAAKAKATAEACGECGRPIGPAEAVALHGVKDGGRGTVAAVCTDCVRESRSKSRRKRNTVQPSLPCEWCERPILVDDGIATAAEGAMWPLTFCCQSCRVRWHNRRHSALRKADRKLHLDKVCEVCAREFTGTRADAKTCSAACKQKAYRQRRG